MSWLDGVLDTLTKAPVCGYLQSGPAASEPTALAALALLGHGYRESALEATAWLARLQGTDGSVGVCEGQATPAWTTSLAMLAWIGAGERSSNLARALAWTLKMKGQAIPPTRETLADLGHDTTLVAWPWCEGTHSWLEPTAFFVLALKAAG